MIQNTYYDMDNSNGELNGSPSAIIDGSSNSTPFSVKDILNIDGSADPTGYINCHLDGWVMNLAVTRISRNANQKIHSTVFNHITLHRRTCTSIVIQHNRRHHTKTTTVSHQRTIFIRQLCHIIIRITIRCHRPDWSTILNTIHRTIRQQRSSIRTIN